MKPFYLMPPLLLVCCLANAETEYFLEWNRFEIDIATNQELTAEAIRGGVNLPVSESVNLQFGAAKGIDATEIELKNLLSAELVYSHPLVEGLMLQGGAGWNRIDLQFEGSKQSATETMLGYGLGVQYQVQANWKAHAWYKNYGDFSFQGVEMDMLGYNFGIDYTF